MPASAKIRCVIHIGTEKTGTSSIQQFLSNNRGKLLKDGILYPKVTGLMGGSQWGFVIAADTSAYQSDIGKRLKLASEQEAQRYVVGLKKALAEELAKNRHVHTIMVSCEHFHSRLRTPNVIERLKAFFEQWCDTFEIIVYFRRQDRVALSHYSTKLKSGNPNPSVFPDGTNPNESYYYDYQRIYENWCEIFESSVVSVGLYDEVRKLDGGLLADFCRRGRIELNGKQLPKRVNSALNARGIQLLLELNRTWPKKQGKPVGVTRAGLASVIARENSGKCAIASRREAETFYQRFAETNAELAKGIAPDRDWPIFDTDFSEYPESPPAFRAEASAALDQLMIREARRLKSSQTRFNLTLSKFTGLFFGARSIDAPFTLHVGLPKTATSALQATLFKQHPEIYFIGGFENQGVKKGCRSQEWYESLYPMLWNRQPLGLHGKRRNISAVKKALLDYDGGNLVGSWEALGLLPRRGFQIMLANVLAVFPNTKVLFSIRNPLDRLPSAYLQALSAVSKHAKHHTFPRGTVFVEFDDWLRTKRSWKIHDTRFDFEDNFRLAVDVLGRDRVGIFLQEELRHDHRAFFCNVAEFVGVDGQIAREIPNELWNLAISSSQVDYLRAIELGDPKEKELFLNASSADRREWLQSALEGKALERHRISLTSDQAEFISDKSKNLNRFIAETFELDLKKYSYPL